MSAINLERSRAFRPKEAPEHAWPVPPRDGWEATGLEPGVCYVWHWLERRGVFVYEMAGQRPMQFGPHIVRRVAECTSEEAAVAAMRLLLGCAEVVVNDAPSPEPLRPIRRETP